MRVFVSAFRALLLVAVVTVGCTGEGGGSRTFSPVPSAPAAWLRIDGPSRVQPNATVSLTAHLVRAGSPDANVTATAEWTTTTARVLAVEPAGQITGVASGDGIVEVRYQDLFTSVALRVIADGTFVVHGVVVPNVAGTRARVEATPQSGPARVVEASSAGAFSIVGIAGPHRLTARLDGFGPVSVDLDVRDDTRQDFKLPLGQGAPRWRLELTPSELCEGFSQRRLAAAVGRLVDGSSVFRTPAAQPELLFAGWLTAGGFDLPLSTFEPGDDYYPPGVHMRTADGHAYELIGFGHAVRDGSDFSGTAEGYVTTRMPEGYCLGPGHRFTLQRR